MYFTIFAARAEGKYARFPLDMLRYDACHPYQQTDVTRIDDSLRSRLGKVDGPEIQQVMLVQYHPNKQHQLTPARWQSFGWDITVKETRKRA